MKKTVGGSTGEISMGIIFQWCLDFSVYFYALISNMIFISYENEFLTIKISKYSIILLVYIFSHIEKMRFLNNGKIFFQTDTYFFSPSYDE